MKRLLPAPLLSALLFVLWLVLNPPLGAGQAILGAIVAVALPAIAAPLRPLRARLRRPATVVRLLLIVGLGVLRSNLDVARGIFRLRARPSTGAFVKVPLELTDPSALAVLAMITTVVPGTVWTELAIDHSAVLLHVFDVENEAAFVADFKARYERPLKEIFE
jgi:multicomponent K+:H+ antiporter subunit E